MEDDYPDDVFDLSNTRGPFRPRREPLAADARRDQSRQGHVPTVPIRNKSMNPIPENKEDLYGGSLIGSMDSLDSSDNQPFEKKKLTVNKKWKVDEQLNKRMQASNKPSILIPIAKWISTFLLATGLFACLAASKYSILKLAVRLRITSNQDDRTGRVEATHLFLMIFLALVLPYLLNFLRALIVSLFRSDMPWPNRRSVLLGILSATLESFGMCVFALKVLTSHDGATGILLMNSVFIIPFFSTMMQSISSRERTTRRSRLHSFAKTGGFLFQIVGVGLAVYPIYEENRDDLLNMWHSVAAVVSISIAWLPSLQKNAVKPILVDDLEAEMLKTHRPQTDAGNVSSGSSGFNTGSNTPISMETSEAMSSDNNDVSYVPQLRNTTWKMAIISNFVKVVGVMIFSFIFFYVDSKVYSINNIFSPETHEEFLEAWNIIWDTDTEYFLINILTTVGGYTLGFIACHIAIHTWAFAIPINLTGPVFVMILAVQDWCQFILSGTEDACMEDTGILWAIIMSSVCLLLAHLLSATYAIFRFKTTVLQRESAVFWIPSFNGVCLEQWLILNRRTGVTDIHSVKPHTGKQMTQVYICTTMYRETEDEMRQLLESINRVNMARKDNDRFFESHVIFDGGVRNKNVSEFALQLLTLLQETLNIRTENCTKVKTPYGMKLSWNLPRHSDKINHMTFNIHLKDGLKVKNKKRWSQVMYMSYVIDFLMVSENDENCYILTTDADVKFTPESVEALLDLMTRDTRVGAVCARTHPMGSGPLVWYQVFEYAIGHWFQKAAEHVLGSVLCAPGCFSVYRCVALKEILTVYATNVEHAFDFLTKDMGEDRWLCTLMVQSGWRIEYCAASENATNCPSEFAEFYKQRRRWVASTIANLMLLMKQWQIIRHFNQRIALLFIVYQGALLFSTLIGPSTVILIISGGLTYGWNVDSVTSVVIQLIVCVIFAFMCLYTSEKTQMLSAKLLTFFYAIVMTAVAVGTAEQIVADLNKNSGTSANGTTTTLPPSDISVDIPMSVTTIYFAAIAAIYITAALLHPKESYCLVNGLWYFLCLPSGYLVLMIYSVCNITDRSWGTREEKTELDVKQEPWYSSIRNVLENIFFCCGPKSVPTPQTTTPVETQASMRWQSTDDVRVSHSASLESLEESMPEPTTPQHRAFPGAGPDADDDIEQDIYIPIPVEEWLDTGLRERYSKLFKINGFENTMFISGMTEKELKNIGVTVKAHLQFLLTEIETLPSFEIEYAVPSSVEEWLETIGLSSYRRTFKRNHIKKPEDLSVLKSFKRKEIENELKITKAGHVKRLLYAIRKLRDPTEAEKRAMDMKARVDRSPRHHLKRSNVGEYDFWKQLINDSLKPGNKAFGIEGELKERLSDLRNSWLLILAVTNTLWLILITTLASKGELTVLGANPLGLSFLFIFGTLLVIQFLAMILHRVSTLVHFLARAPFKYGAPMRAFWSFDDDYRYQRAETRDDWEAIQTIKHQENEIREKKRKERVQMSRSYGSHTETTSLINRHAASEV